GAPLHGPAGPVNAAVGIEKGVDGAGLRTPAHAAIAQIEGGVADFEEVEILVRALCGYDERLVAAAAAQQPAGDARDPPRIAGDGSELAIVPGIKADRD